MNEKTDVDDYLFKMTITIQKKYNLSLKETRDNINTAVKEMCDYLF